MGIIVALLGLIFLDPMLRMFVATDTVLPYARDYASTVLMGVPFSVLGITMSNMARTDGNPRLSMYGILIGAVLNTILDPIYIFVFTGRQRGGSSHHHFRRYYPLILCLYFWKKGNMRFKFKLMKPVPRCAAEP